MMTERWQCGGDALAQEEAAHPREGRHTIVNTNSAAPNRVPSAQELDKAESAPTDFAEEPMKTCKTGETCAAVSNKDFLRGVFHSNVDDARPGIVSFIGSPATVPGSAWFAHPAGDDLLCTANNYFTLSSFYNDDAGRFRRTKKTFAGLHAVMLDDLGSKVDLERLTFQLSWLIETSPGNYQGGLILDEPLRDAAMTERLMNAVIAAGLCDPGANGPTARLARLPVAVNGKHDPAFQCRLIEWAPERRYSVEALVDALGLELAPAGRPKVQRKADQAQGRHPGPDDVFIAAPRENPVLAALKAKSLYKQPLGNGKHDITCPWCAEHTDGVDGGTAYFEPDDVFPVGGFRCLHSHGDRLHIRDLLTHLAFEPAAARMKPIVRVQPGALDRIVDRAEYLLAMSGRYYQSAGLIATVQTDPADDETSIVPATQPALLRAMARVADWQRYDARSENWVVSDPPSRHTAVLFDAKDYPHLPVLRGIARQPHLRGDGKIVAVSGYDQLTGRFGVFDARQYDIPAHPTRDDALHALAVLEDVLAEVAFDTYVDRAAALSAMLTAAVRPSLPTAPAFLVAAHVRGSGKSFLSRLISSMATQQNVPGIAFPSDADEMRKTLIALLIKSPAVINFDDLSGDIIPSEALKTALTEEFIGGRILGLSKTVSASTRTLVLFSGNNIAPVRDMARRVLTIYLDPRCEEPVTRTFARPHLEAEVRRDRAKYVTAALTIIRAWMQAGCPSTCVKPVASYNQWSEWCRQPLLWLGLPDPASRLFEQLAHDPDTELLGRVLVGWYGAHGGMPILVRDVVCRAESSGDTDFTEALRDVAEERGVLNRRRLGWWLKRHVGRIVDGLKFERGGNARGAETWRVVQVLQVLQVPLVGSTKSVSSGEGGEAMAPPVRGDLSGARVECSGRLGELPLMALDAQPVPCN